MVELYKVVDFNQLSEGQHVLAIGFHALRLREVLNAGLEPKYGIVPLEMEMDPFISFNVKTPTVQTDDLGSEYLVQLGAPYNRVVPAAFCDGRFYTLNNSLDLTEWVRSWTSLPRCNNE